MMDAYQSLSGFYDSLTTDIPYEAFADYYESVFQQHPGEFRMLLDLCCGTGTLTRILALRGYEMIAADASEEMLMQAREKCADLSMPPLFLCQEAAELDLYGTVDAAVCSLDGMNYLSPEELPEVFHRLHLFIRPGGMLIFDIRSPESFATLDGGIWVDETEEVFCLWRSEFDPEAKYAELERIITEAFGPGKPFPETGSKMMFMEWQAGQRTIRLNGSSHDVRFSMF